MNPFDIEECIRFGWKTFQRRPLYLIAVTVLVASLTFVPGILIGRMPTSGLQLALQIADSVVSILIGMGTTAFYLKACDDVTSSWIGDLWHPRGFGSYLGGAMLIGLIGIVCGVAFGIPVGLLRDHLAVQISVGVLAFALVLWVVLRFGFALVIVIDRSMGAVQAMKESARLLHGRVWRLIWLVVVLGIVDLMGLLFFGVGILVALPVTHLAWIYAYREVVKHAEAAPAVELAPTAELAVL